MSYGLLPEGFVIKPLQVIKSEMEAEVRAIYGASVDTSPASVLGQWIGIQSERESALWELALAVWNARSQAGAGGVTQDNLYALTGTLREAPQKSTVDVTWTGSAGTAIPAGRVLSVAGNPEARFVTLTDATVGGGGTVDVEMESEDYGPIGANAGTLTVIETPVGGITSVTNALDAELGADEETDAAFRIRQQDELRGDGKAAVEAIRAALLQVPGVEGVTVFHNTSATTDGDGIPPHAIEALVEGGDDDDVREAIWEAVGGGIATHGTESGTVVDGQGDSQTVKFSRPTGVPIALRFTIQRTSDWPAGGDDLFKEAVVARGDELARVGRDVILSAFGKPFWEMSGAHKLTSIEGSVHPAAVGSSDVVVGAREYPEYDTGRITLVASTVVPP